MSKLYKIDDNEFEELIKNIALNNETIIHNNDPVLIFFTIAKYVFKEYAEELDKKIDNLGYQQRDIIDEFQINLDNKKIENDKEFQNKMQLIINQIKAVNDEKIENTLCCIEEKINNLNKDNKKMEDNFLINNFYIKLLLIGNIILSLLILYLIF